MQFLSFALEISPLYFVPQDTYEDSIPFSLDRHICILIIPTLAH